MEDKSLSLSFEKDIDIDEQSLLPDLGDNFSLDDFLDAPEKIEEVQDVKFEASVVEETSDAPEKTEEEILAEEEQKAVSVGDTEVKEIETSEQIEAKENNIVEDVSEEEHIVVDKAEEKKLDIEDKFNTGGYDIISSAGFINWFSGKSTDKRFEISRESSEDKIVGEVDKRIIHINVGYDTYGWIVKFANGLVMSLYDLREYQLRNGKLPDESGDILYGERVTSFEGIEKITIYENIRYFTYG